MSGLLTPDARLRVFGDTGLVLPGAKLYTYVAGSLSTTLATYSDSALLIANTNPVVASAGGLFGPIFLTLGVAYQFLLKDSAGVTVPGWPQDNVMVPSNFSAATLTNHGVLVGTASTTINATAVGATGTALGGVTGADPTFQTVPTILGTQTANTLLAGPTTGAAALPTFRALVAADLAALTFSPVLDRSTTEQDVSNTTTPTDVYSYAVPGGTLGTTGVLRTTADGSIDNGTGGGVNLTIAVTYGATTLYTAAITTVAAAAAKMSWRARVTINANGATNSQRALVEITLGANAANTDGATQAVATNATSVQTALAEDSTASKNLKVTVTWASASASLHCRRYLAMTEKL